MLCAQRPFMYMYSTHEGTMYSAFKCTMYSILQGETYSINYKVGLQLISKLLLAAQSLKPSRHVAGSSMSTPYDGLTPRPGTRRIFDLSTTVTKPWHHTIARACLHHAPSLSPGTIPLQGPVCIMNHH